MSFWNQHEDPWNKKDGISKPPKEPKENPIDSLKQWNEDRKAAAKEKEEAKRLPPEPCPWCGTDMEQGYIAGGRDSVSWHPGIYKFDLFRGLDGTAINVLDEGGAFSGYYKTAWLCRACKKAVFRMPDSPADPFAPQTETEEPEEEEEREE